ncbi:hypothetical protein H0Z11_09730 [Pantoea agglomerans]|nr:hypothetical protein H0Z11_09730 [Pantoea agglomerans]
MCVYPTQTAISKAVRVVRKIFVITPPDKCVHEAERWPLPGRRNAAAKVVLLFINLTSLAIPVKTRVTCSP